MVKAKRKGTTAKLSKKKTTASKFKYRPTSEAAIKQRAEQTGGRFDSPFKQEYELWRPKQGDNTVRILPPTWDEAEHYALEIWLHRGIGPDNSSYLDIQKMQGKRNPIADAAREAKDGGEEEEAKALQSKKASLVWVIDRDDDTPTPKLWIMSWTIDRDVSALCINRKRGEVIRIDNPDDGYDLTFRRTGEGLRTRYSAFVIDRDPTPVSEDPREQASILDYIVDNPLPSTLQYYDAKYLEQVLSGTQEEKDEDLDDDEDEDDDEEEE